MRFGPLVGVLVLLVAGCLGVSPSTADGDAQASLPSVDRCGTDALPDPERTDGLTLSDYPVPPEQVNESSVVGYIIGFDRAYFRNVIIAEAAADRDMNLTRVTVSGQPKRVERTGDGYVVVLASSAGTMYESGVHGDRWPTIGYFVNETVLVRANVDGVNASVGEDNAATLLRCPT